jgi:hypothetical protein
MREMIGLAERKWRGQDRRIRKKRRRGEMNGGANRAVIVRLASRMPWRILMRGRGGGRGDTGDAITAREVIEMNVSERKDELQQHRCKRKPCAGSSIGTNQMHQANRPARILE